jgi:hypothetical protein
MILTGENRRTRIKVCPSAILSTTNSTWIDPGLRGERSATNDLSHDTAFDSSYFKVIYFLYTEGFGEKSLVILYATCCCCMYK